MSTIEQKVQANDWLRREMKDNPANANHAAIILDELDRLAKLANPLRAAKGGLESPFLPRHSDIKDGLELPHARWYRTMVQNLYACIERRDWHGASDTANDLRELEAAYPVLKEARR